MAIYGLIDAGKVVDAQMHAELPGDGWVRMDDVSPQPGIGWTYDGQAFAPPPAPAPTPSRHFSSLQFLALFTPDEQATIVGSSDTEVRLFMWMAGSASFVDLDDDRTKGGIACLVSLKLLTQARADAVLAATAPTD